MDSPPSGDARPGLSDPLDVFSRRRRQMLDLVNRLQSTGVQTEIDLPMIAVVGNQSAGKSSLIESISGITLPRASGTCTRCPAECRLSYSTQAWKCDVALRFLTDQHGIVLGQPRTVPFGSTITDKTLVEERLRRAQRAILSPGKDVNQFLDEDETRFDEPDAAFSRNTICLQISGKDLADLSFVDLPGLIVSVRSTGSESDIKLVEGLVTSYISSQSCLILLTVTCETDFENQGAYNLAKNYDPEGKRTIGVLTKPDKIDTGDEEHWLSFIRNDSEPLVNGWFAVKQPNTESLKAGISWAEARANEDLFFSATNPWSRLEPEYQKRLRTSRLVPQLSVILSDLIAKRLPEIREEIHKGLQKTEALLAALPSPPSSEPVAEIYALLSRFSADVLHEIGGTSDEDGLIQVVRPLQETFRRAVRATVPTFYPYTRAEEEDQGLSLSKPQFLSSEEIPEDRDTGDTGIYVDEVMTRAEKAISREFPDHTPFIVVKQYVQAFLARWEMPAQDLCDDVNDLVLRRAKKLVDRHFADYEFGGLERAVDAVITEQIGEHLEETQRQLKYFMELEEMPLTLNGHYYADYKDKFLNHYRASISSVYQQLQSFMPTGSEKPSTLEEGVTEMLTGAAKLGLAGLTPVDLARLAPIQVHDRALRIMAEVRAYFQVAYKRFVDQVALAVDHGLVRGLGRKLQEALFEGLGVGGPDGYRNCKEFLQEPPSTANRREELSKRRERLAMAKKELTELRLPYASPSQSQAHVHTPLDKDAVLPAHERDMQPDMSSPAGPTTDSRALESTTSPPPSPVKLTKKQKQALKRAQTQKQLTELDVNGA